MPTTPNLTSADRDLFSAIASAAFANPFSPQREALDRRIAGISTPIARDELFARAVFRVETALAELRAAGLADPRLYRGEMQQVMRTVCLFDVYHRFRLDFDGLIARQIAAGDTPLPVPFAREACAQLIGQGFSASEAVRYFAIFYQVRRAFHFIESGLVGSSSAMHTLRMHLWNGVFTADIGRYEALLWNRMEDFSTLLLGETGTGKGAAAAAIGRSGFIPFDEKKGAFSESFTRNFISLNLSQFPEPLIESELFGHRKGAFTGAIGDHAGVFARCSPHGSIFLDEIGDLSIPVQIKLLQVLQERSFTPVGSHERLRFHGRVIAATHKPLDVMRGDGRFRDDFYYRLCSNVISVPTLRQRLAEEPAELGGLVTEILRRLLGNDDHDLAAGVVTVLQRDIPTAYPWPGNVRELEQAVRRILVSGSYAPPPPPSSSEDLFVAAVAAGTLDARQLLAGYCRRLHGRCGTVEEVARRTDLDRRTVKKYLDEQP